jgi:hypothetical protein
MERNQPIQLVSKKYELILDCTETVEMESLKHEKIVT